MVNFLCLENNSFSFQSIKKKKESIFYMSDNLYQTIVLWVKYQQYRNRNIRNLKAIANNAYPFVAGYALFGFNSKY